MEIMSFPLGILAQFCDYFIMYENNTVSFIGIGTQKSATSWLYNCLNQHPEISGLSYESIL